MKTGEITHFSYTGKPQEITLNKGIYKLEVWGAEGGGYRLSGNADAGDGGRGGYATGVLTLNAKQTLYIYVGGHGKSSTGGIANGGWNGGGCAWASSSGEPGNGGGGATDIRLVGGAWSNANSLKSRIIVAGGGGGGGEDTNETGGYGGGTSGGSTYGATQTSTSGGGAFGKGAHTPNDGGGGGGGWYGGGTTNGSQTKPTANSTADTSATASGGSGYVLTETSSKPDGYTPTEEYYLVDTELLAGNVSIPKYDSTGTQTGNIGHGHVVITCIESSSVDARCKIEGSIKNVNLMKVKVNNSWKDIARVMTKVNGVWK